MIGFTKSLVTEVIFSWSSLNDDILLVMVSCIQTMMLWLSSCSLTDWFLFSVFSKAKLVEPAYWPTLLNFTKPIYKHSDTHSFNDWIKIVEFKKVYWFLYLGQLDLTPINYHIYAGRPSKYILNRLLNFQIAVVHRHRI